MERRYRVDLALFDPEVAAKEGPPAGLICEQTTYGETLEGAVGSAIISMAPHVTHMGYEFVVTAIGVWCETHGCWHNISEQIEGHKPGQVVFESQGVTN